MRPDSQDPGAPDARLGGSALAESLPWAAIVASLPDGVALIDAGGFHREVNGTLCGMVGIPREELLGSGPPYSYVAPEYHEACEALVGRALRGELATAELVVRDRSGRRYMVLARANPVSSAELGVRSAVLVFTDVTERTRLETKLRDSERRWRSIVENPFEFVVVLDRNYRYLFVDHAEPGIRLEDLIGKATPFDFVEPQFHPVMREAYDKAFREGVTTTYDVYTSVLDKWTSNIVGPIFEGAEVTSLSVLVRDTTQAKRAEQALQSAQKLDMLSTVVSAVARDFRLAVEPIAGNVSRLLRETDEKSSAHPLLVNIARAAERASEFVGRLDPFEQSAEQAVETVSVSTIAGEVLSRVVGSLPAVRLSMDIANDAPSVSGFSFQIQQAIENLLDNARRALSKGGELFVSVVPVTIDESFASRNSMHTGAAVRVVVRDGGHGMSQHTLARAFEPFFTTWREQGCSGLGLSMVKAIATRHGGAVVARSSVRDGTTVELYLPAQGPLPARPREIAGTTSRRVLCIDDEAAVLKLTRRVLERAGHAVVTSQYPLEALELLKGAPLEFDVVISDQLMPRMTGVELAEKVLSFAPELPFLLVSGFCDPNIVTPVNVRAFLQKPVPVEALLGAVEACERR